MRSLHLSPYEEWQQSVVSTAGSCAYGRREERLRLRAGRSECTRAAILLHLARLPFSCTAAPATPSPQVKHQCRALHTQLVAGNSSSSVLARAPSSQPCSGRRARTRPHRCGPGASPSSSHRRGVDQWGAHHLGIPAHAVQVIPMPHAECVLTPTAGVLCAPADSVSRSRVPARRLRALPPEQHALPVRRAGPAGLHHVRVRTPTGRPSRRWEHQSRISAPADGLRFRRRHLLMSALGLQAQTATRLDDAVDRVGGACRVAQ